MMQRLDGARLRSIAAIFPAKMKIKNKAKERSEVLEITHGAKLLHRFFNGCV